MFDIGFFELLLIAVVGLLVIGPERLPTTIRTVALWVGRIKRSIRETRLEVEKQLGADEIRRELHNEQVMRNLEKMRTAHQELEKKIHNFAGDSGEGAKETKDAKDAKDESNKTLSAEPAASSVGSSEGNAATGQPASGQEPAAAHSSVNGSEAGDNSAGDTPATKNPANG